MNEKFKDFLFCAAVVIVALALTFTAGFLRGCSYAEADGRDSERAERYEERNASASESVGRIEGGLGSMAEKMREAGTGINKSLTRIGELREDGARIAERGQSIEDAAGRIEDRIYLIEQILFEAEKGNCILADSSDYISSGGGN